MDDSLDVERQNLYYLKKSLEVILKPVQEQLFVSIILIYFIFNLIIYF